MAPNGEMTGHPLAPSVQLPLLPSGPGGIHGLQSRGPGHHAIWRKSVAERVGFEPTVRCRTLAFQASTFVHSVIPPFSHFPLLRSKGGEGGIRTHGGREPTVDFESTAFVHSATSPQSSRRFFRMA